MYQVKGSLFCLSLSTVKKEVGHKGAGRWLCRCDCSPAWVPNPRDCGHLTFKGLTSLGLGLLYTRG